MASPTALPDPTLGERPDFCLGCAYSLEGTPEGAVCPECGTPSPIADQTLVLCGVARSTETKTWRRWAWGFIFAGAFIYSQVLPILVFQRPLYAGLVFAVIVAGVVGMLVSGSSGKRGTERFTFTPAGYARVGLNSDVQPEYFPWPEHVEYEVKRVSSVWHRLRLIDRSGGKKRVLLDAGFRCPVEDCQMVSDALAAMVDPTKLAPDTTNEGTSDV